MTSTQLQQEILSLPKDLQQEVEDFVAFLKSKYQIQKPKITKREFGAAKGKIIMSDDFDEPLDEFKDYM